MTTPHSKEEEEEQMHVLCNTNTHSKRSWMTAMKDEDACSSSSLPLSNQCPSTSNSSTKEYYYYMKNDHGLVGKTKRTSHNSWNSIINNNNNNNATLKDDENHHDPLYQNYNLSTKRRRPCRQMEPNTIKTLSTDHPQSSIQQHYPYNNRDYYYCCYNQEEQTNNEWVHDNGNNQDDSFQASSTPTNNNHHIHNTIKNQYDVTMKSKRSREEVPCVLPTNNNKDPIPIHDDHSTKRRKTLNNNETILQQNEPWYELNTTTSLPIKMHAPLSVATTTTTITPSCSNWWWQQQQQRVTKDPVDAKLEQLIRQSMHEAKQQQQQQQQQQSSLSSTMMMEIDDDDDACF